MKRSEKSLVKRLDARFQTCAELQELFRPLSPDLVAVQLSPGPLHGRVRIFVLGSYRFNVLETSQSLFLSGTRRTKPCTLAIPLTDAMADQPYRAQGIAMPWAGLMGYNRSLSDFDLRVPARAALATVVIGKEALLERHTQQGGGPLMLKRWESTNQLEVQTDLRLRLQKQLNNLVERNQDTWKPEEPDQLIETLIRCFEAPKSQTMPIAKRETRHEAAIELLHWCAKNTSKSLTMNELSAELHQSRTSLFKGSREHFDCTPLQLHRSMRMDKVRQLLLGQGLRQTIKLQGVGAIASAIGFTSRSHFARQYQQHYGERPQDTLNRNSNTPN
ncbi:transcriptional regulator/ AraC family protein [Synechococcus sp. BIOS-U3-1]|uniref:AraC family transcriptional regulator n=1 Tax=Synechococcus sp. BIOS-U3-1 TaxID=1400865 RepID=UPI0018609A98|nr:helix-turn-helix domain-containing protein [Synechococcus sp. BIOS-U3-1]QNI60180.1 transcriptional regulator/ AraC family protein [Synechococcus sp. BIOS-U3-1]